MNRIYHLCHWNPLHSRWRGRHFTHVTTDFSVVLYPRPRPRVLLKLCSYKIQNQLFIKDLVGTQDTVHDPRTPYCVVTIGTGVPEFQVTFPQYVLIHPSKYSRTLVYGPSGPVPSFPKVLFTKCTFDFCYSTKIYRPLGRYSVRTWVLHTTDLYPKGFCLGFCPYTSVHRKIPLLGPS